MQLSALAINCTLKAGGEPSSTEFLLCQVLDGLHRHDVETDLIRAVDFDILPGVVSDAGEGDDWPPIRDRILATDILILGSPIWLGQPSSVCKRVPERINAFLGERDDAGRMVSYGTVAGVAVVGNEDGAHHVSAEIFQALNDCGFSLAANAVTYWVGEAMQKTDYRDKDQPVEKTRNATEMMVGNAMHLARMLKRSDYPGQS